MTVYLKEEDWGFDVFLEGGGLRHQVEVDAAWDGRAKKDWVYRDGTIG